ncbi:MAG TPA: CDP-diacylglycerol--glycerol-3-phosphate 3-phosphatidyltransferase [Streptosporangiaceae bacterium]|nr:CDP-diacylglycerol--glycerol-3-phosphate 3-phosphatidyltransferase [Streptosporangiaceae bacterium]
MANALTVLRLLLVPVFVALLVAGGPGYRLAAFAAFAIASVTDLLDGELARRRNLITDFGKIADPIADKALTGSALVTLSALGQLAWWVTVVILARELAVTALRFWVIRHGVIAASRGGKIKTMLQVIAISLYILPGGFWLERRLVMGAAVIVTVVTGVDYTVRAVRLHRAVPGQPAGRAAGPGPAAARRADPGQAGSRPAGPGPAAGPGQHAEKPVSAGSDRGSRVQGDSAVGDSATSEPAFTEPSSGPDVPGRPRNRGGPAARETGGGQS